MINQKNHKAPVLIVGGGPVGLTIGIVLQQYGINCVIIEKRKALAVESKGLMLSPASLHIFDRLGVIEALEQQAYKVGHANLYWNGKRMYRLPFHKMETPFNYLIMLPQPITESVLRDRFEALGGTFHTGTELVDIIQGDQNVFASLKQGGKEFGISCDHLVGADGTKSRVRNVLGIQSALTTPDFMHFILGDFKVDWKSGNLEETHYFINEECFMIVLPLDDKYHRVFFKGEGYINKDDQIDLERIQAVAKKIAPSDFILSKPKWLSSVNHHSNIASTFVSGKVYLAGDAAHSFSPMGGQGMNTGLQDAYNLGWRLALVIQQKAPQDFLQQYNSERHAVAEATTASVMSNTRLICREDTDLNGPLKHFLPNRENVSFLNDTLPKLMSGLLLSYPAASQKVEQSYFASNYSGRLVPLQSQVSEFKHLFDPLYYTLLIFNPDDIASLEYHLELIQNTYQDMVVPVVVFDPKNTSASIQSSPWLEQMNTIESQALLHIFEARNNATMIVRPDLIVAWQGGLDELKSLTNTVNQIDLAG